MNSSIYPHGTKSSWTHTDISRHMVFLPPGHHGGFCLAAFAVLRGASAIFLTYANGRGALTWSAWRLKCGTAFALGRRAISFHFLCIQLVPGQRVRRLLISSLIFLATTTSWASPLLAAEEGAALFGELCSVCHGAGGKGDGPSAQGLEPKPADFSDCKAMARDSDDILFKIIKGGGQSVGRSTVMPSWRDVLNDRQMRELVRYIRSLCNKK